MDADDGIRVIAPLKPVGNFPLVNMKDVDGIEEKFLTLDEKNKNLETAVERCDDEIRILDQRAGFFGERLRKLESSNANLWYGLYLESTALMILGLYVVM